MRPVLASSTLYFSRDLLLQLSRTILSHESYFSCWLMHLHCKQFFGVLQHICGQKITIFLFFTAHATFFLHLCLLPQPVSGGFETLSFFCFEKTSLTSLLFTIVFLFLLLPISHCFHHLITHEPVHRISPPHSFFPQLWRHMMKRLPSYIAAATSPVTTSPLVNRFNRACRQDCVSSHRCPPRRTSPSSSVTSFPSSALLLPTKRSPPLCPDQACGIFNSRDFLDLLVSFHQDK